MTLKQIAEQLNVSPSTVSLVLHKKEGVSEETRKRVLETLLSHGYVPSSIEHKNGNNAAHAIRFLKYSKHSQVVDGNEGFVASIIDSAEQEARTQGYDFIMTSFGDDTMVDTFAMVREQPYQGVIFLGTEFAEKDFHFLNDFPVPLVVVDNRMEFFPIDSVTMDNQDIVHMAIRHLYDLNHRQIGYLRSKTQIANFSERFFAYEKCMQKLNLPYAKEHVYSISATMQGAYVDTIELIQKKKEFPPALFADNDSIAMGAIKALREYDYKIPEDISIIGFDDIPFCSMIEPPLTTMRVPTAEIGKWTIRRLCQKISEPDTPVIKMQFGAELILRKSTCAY